MPVRKPSRPRITGTLSLGLGALAGALALATAPPAAAETDAACEGIGVGREIGSAVVLLAESKAAAEDVPAYCRVIAVARPSAGSNIVIETWLPARARWNGKVLANGSGGFAGTIAAVMHKGALKFGYATASTDMGTYPAGVGFNGGARRPEVVKDFGYRATHEMAVLLKALTQRYYGQPATRSYYAGCSTGGQQGLMSAQRYPDDFDGIIAGAPAHNRTHLHIMFNQRWAAARDMSTRLSPAQRALWANEVNRDCLPGNVTAPGDVYMAAPMRCRTSPRKLLCKSGQDQATCLTEPQVRTLEILYDGIRNPRTGALISPAFPRGIESQLGTFLGSSGEFDMTRWVFGPDWDINSFDYDKDVDLMDAKLASITNAMNPDLSRFAARGGKLIMFHGLEDTAISPLDTLDYYDRITAKNHRKADFTRLFLAPGVGHCAGGRGPNFFGQLPLTMSGDPSSDMIMALDRWVEKGIAPARIVASPVIGKPDAPGARPLCPYPQVAKYDGKGEVARPDSYACVNAPAVEYEPIASKYRR